MAFTEDFRKILRNKRRSFGFEIGMREAITEANNIGIAAFRERKKPEPRFKRQNFPPIL